MPVVRTGRKPHNVSQTPGAGSIVLRKATLSGYGTVTNLAGVGPTGGAQAIRDAAGVQGLPTVSVFSGTAGVNFRQMVPGDSTAAMQADLDSALVTSTHKVYWPPGTYRTTSSIIFSISNVEHRFATGPLRTEADTAIFKGSSVVSTPGIPAAGGYYYNQSSVEDFTASEDTARPLDYNDNPAAALALETYYKNDVLMYPMQTKAEVAGTNNRSYVDVVPATNVAWFGYNPPASTLEKLEFYGSNIIVRAAGITIKGGIFTHAGFANIRVDGTTATGAVCDDFTIQDAEISYAREKNMTATGVTTRRIDNITINRCYFHHGGRYNFSGSQHTNLTISNCERSFGNFLHWGEHTGSPYDEGNDKILFSFQAHYDSNWDHDNDGSAIWGDTHVDDLLVEDCVLEDNFGSGIHYENSNMQLGQGTNGAVRRCYLANNMKDGTQPAPYTAIGGWGSQGGGFFLSQSQAIEIYDCWFHLNKHQEIKFLDLGVGQTSPYRNEDMWIHDNLFEHTDSDAVDEWLYSWRDNAITVFGYLAAANNRFNFNTYHVRTGGRTGDPNAGTAQWFGIPSSNTQGKTFAQWQAGNTFVTDGSPASFNDPNSTLVADL